MLFPALFPAFPAHILEDVKNFALEHEIWMRNIGQSFWKQQVSPDDFKSIAMLSFHKMLTGKDGNYFTLNGKYRIEKFL